MAIKLWLAVAAVAVAALVPAAGAKTPPWVVLVEDCLTPADKKLVIGFRAADGTRLVGITLGRGETGVVLVHGSVSDFCEWVWYARLLAPSYRVLALDVRGTGSSYPAPRSLDSTRYEWDVAAASTELRRRGAKRVFAIGSSLGAATVLVAASTVKPQLAGVVALSAPATRARWFDAVGSVRRASTPLLLVASRGDRNFAADARTLYRAARTKHKRLLLVGGSAHGSGLLTEPGPAAAVRTFLAGGGRR